MARKSIYNKITSVENWNQVSIENKNLLKEFIEYSRSTDKSEETITNYESDLNIFFTWCFLENSNKFFIDITKRDIIKFQNYLLNVQKLGSSRIRRLRSTLSSLSNYIENILDDDYPIFRNIVNKIPAPAKNEVRNKTVLTDEQIEYLLNYLVEKQEYQKACVFALAVMSGARKSELLRFKISFFTEKNIIYGSLYKTPEKIKTKGRGRAGKPLNKYILVKFKYYLDLWLKERERLNIDGEYLFYTLGNEGYEITKVSSLNSWAKSFSKILGVDFYWHADRHYLNTFLLKAGIPADVIKELFGWESVEMVSRYDDTEADEKFGKYFDANGIKSVENKSLKDL
jgi:integrase